ncbi:hypothetical protein BDV27DRAFT_159439 [Aspergillus caelatus]|uniref:Uncharacterized protein n=1 Tax=Aspergillus caelatus TaxID=61420 RepID=A0A5N6ZYS4_9EURO|nr:uncharacterized protein BDV27DRAFT_159439 [Aspergillus caelatus]KAE8362741.1 hypothetical protein BDV27DRAFT_159439 [Aspergillus caelatus]
MKIQTLVSLAAVGLAFANPIHNLEERDGSLRKCIKTLMMEEVSKKCLSDAACGELQKFIPCMTEAINSDPTSLPFGQLPAEPLKQFYSCTEKIRGSLGLKQVDQLLFMLVEVGNDVSERCFGEEGSRFYGRD